jgi:hypothetical protein
MTNEPLPGPTARNDAELKWTSLYPFLHSKGYELRDRYRPDWVPSWISNPKLCMYDCDDSRTALVRAKSIALRFLFAHEYPEASRFGCYTGGGRQKGCLEEGWRQRGANG